MNKLIEQAYSPENFRKQGHKLIDTLADYLDECISGSKMTVFPYKKPEEWLNKWESDLANSPKLNIAEFFLSIIKDSIHIHHPKYMGHQVSPVIPLSALADFLGAFLDNGVGVYEMGSPTVVIERVVIKKMCKIIGMNEQADGILTSGGTLGNLTSLLAARQSKADFNIWDKGNINGKQLAFLVSEESHFSVARAIKVMGLGEEGIIKLPVNEKFQIRTECLEEYYSKALNENKVVVGIVGNACSTSTGTYDPLDKIADFCEKYDLWFHVDGAHGGPAIFSEKYKHLVKGIERADSVIIDFHKMMMMPSLATAVLFKDGDKSYETFDQKAHYLWEKSDEKEWYNLAKRTFECTKRMISLKIFSIFRTYGNTFFSDIVTHLYDLGKQFSEMVQESSDFELAVEPQSNIVCFRYVPDSIEDEDLNKLNSKIRKRIIENGNFYIVQTNIKNIVYFRVSLMNPFTTMDDLVQLLNEIRHNK